MYHPITRATLQLYQMIKCLKTLKYDNSSITCWFVWVYLTMWFRTWCSKTFSYLFNYSKTQFIWEQGNEIYYLKQITCWLHYCEVIFRSYEMMDCILFTFEIRVPPMLLMNSSNKTEVAIYKRRLCFPSILLFFLRFVFN